MMPETKIGPMTFDLTDGAGKEVPLEVTPHLLIAQVSSLGIYKLHVKISGTPCRVVLDREDGTPPTELGATKDITLPDFVVEDSASYTFYVYYAGAPKGFSVGIYLKDESRDAEDD